MECPQTAPARARNVSRILTLIFVWLAMIVASVQALQASAGTPAATRDQILQQARAHQIRYRMGDLRGVPEYVALLEAATRAYPDDADIWYATGVAYLAQAATALVPGGKPEDAVAPMQKGPAALWRALKLRPDHAEAMAQLGGVQALLGPVLQRPAMLSRGVDQMNRAVELAPTSMRVRLQRAFVGLSLPEALRNPVAEAEDLDFLDQKSDLGRASDYVRLLRADLHFEQGERERAMQLYRFVESTGNAGPAADAKARLASLAAGSVSMSEIRALRVAAGAQCAMCHAPQ